MRRAIWKSVAAVVLATAGVAGAGERRALDADWRFHLGDVMGAEGVAVQDGAWEQLSVPHDWSILGPFDQSNPAGGAGAFLPTGVGWYRKHFALGQGDRGKRVVVEFDGVMANSTVWINGKELGHRPYGYVSFAYDLTPYLKESGENVLAVRVDTSKQPASRWYAGSGINRHVRLVVSDPVHLGRDTVFVTTPKVTDDAATVRVTGVVENQTMEGREAVVEVTVVGPEGKEVASATGQAKAVGAGASAEFEQEVVVPKPQRWDLEHPTLYRVLTKVRVGDQVVDTEETPFGIREFRFEPETGFWLNGKNFKLKGVCVHEQASALGTAIPVSAWERQLAVLKGLGVNAIRTAHNPFSPGFLALCDRMGLVVMDEMFDCWTVGKTQFDYHLYFKNWSLKDLADTVRRDRNHPSVFLYSAGNEIHDTPHPDVAIPILKSLVAEFHKWDPTRPVTQALFRPNVSHDYDNGLADLLDVVGQNYRENEILAAHAQKPSRKILGTENGHDRKSWLPMRDHPEYAGQFLWTGIDYLGEAKEWPRIGSGSGLIDRTGEVKPMGRERESWWSERPMVFACRYVAPPARTKDDPGGYGPLMKPQTQFADWTPTEMGAHEETVDVYSNCESVELVLNGKSLGAKGINKDASARRWKVPFEAGVLKAVGSNGGKAVATQELRTAGKAAKVALKSERERLPQSWDEVAYVSATVVDEQGTPVPTGDQEVTFHVTGPGMIAGVDSADNLSHESFQGDHRKAYQGRCVAILRATAGDGAITVTASAPGLAEGSATITAAGAEEGK